MKTDPRPNLRDGRRVIQKRKSSRLTGTSFSPPCPKSNPERAEDHDPCQIREEIGDITCPSRYKHLAEFFSGRNEEDEKRSSGNKPSAPPDSFVLQREVGSQGEQAKEKEMTELVPERQFLDHLEENGVLAGIRQINDPSDKQGEEARGEEDQP